VQLLKLKSQVAERRRAKKGWGLFLGLAHGKRGKEPIVLFC
jgi:hypothetical protein